MTQASIAFAVGVVTGALVAVLQRTFELFLFLPKLRIGDDSPQPGEKLSGHAIRVRNIGRTTAVNCSGFLTIENLDPREVVEVDDVVDVASLGVDTRLFGVPSTETSSLLVSPSLFRTIEKELLAWARAGNPVSIDIPPGGQVLLDLCREVHGDNRQLQFSSELGWKGVRVVLRPGMYKIEVLVAASNGRSRTQRFDISFNETRATITRSTRAATARSARAARTESTRVGTAKSSRTRRARGRVR